MRHIIDHLLYLYITDLTRFVSNCHDCHIGNIWNLNMDDWLTEWLAAGAFGRKNTPACQLNLHRLFPLRRFIMSMKK